MDAVVGFWIAGAVFFLLVVAIDRMVRKSKANGAAEHHEDGDDDYNHWTAHPHHNDDTNPATGLPMGAGADTSGYTYGGGFNVYDD